MQLKSKEKSVCNVETDKSSQKSTEECRWHGHPGVQYRNRQSKMKNQLKSIGKHSLSFRVKEKSHFWKWHKTVLYLVSFFPLLKNCYDPFLLNNS